MTNIREMVFMSGIPKHKNDDHRSCVEHQGQGRYVWKKQILRSIIIDDAPKKNKRISLFHAHFFLP